MVNDRPQYCYKGGHLTQKKNPNAALDKIVAAAETEGLSYGKYVAKHESAVYNYPRKRRRIKEEPNEMSKQQTSSRSSSSRCDTSTCFAYKSGKCPFYKTQSAEEGIIHTKRRTQHT